MVFGWVFGVVVLRVFSVLIGALSVAAAVAAAAAVPVVAVVDIAPVVFPI